MEPIKVVCGIIWQNGEVFIARRRPGKSLAGFWEFPGGKLEKNEDPDAALVRELQEELGMQVRISHFFGRHVHHYKDFSIELQAYKCDFIQATYLLTDHDEFAFVKPQDLRDYKIAPADVFFVDLLSKNAG